LKVGLIVPETGKNNLLKSRLPCSATRLLCKDMILMQFLAQFNTGENRLALQRNQRIQDIKILDSRHPIGAKCPPLVHKKKSACTAGVTGNNAVIARFSDSTQVCRPA
jgi:hypothetical protein